MVGELHTLDSSGNMKIIWDTAHPETVEAARKTFNDLRGKRYLAFKVDDKGDKGEPMSQFDPSAKMLIMAPPVVAG